MFSQAHTEEDPSPDTHYISNQYKNKKEQDWKENKAPSLKTTSKKTAHQPLSSTSPRLRHCPPLGHLILSFCLQRLQQYSAAPRRPPESIAHHDTFAAVEGHGRPQETRDRRLERDKKVGEVSTSQSTGELSGGHIFFASLVERNILFASFDCFDIDHGAKMIWTKGEHNGEKMWKENVYAKETWAKGQNNMSTDTCWWGRSSWCFGVCLVSWWWFDCMNISLLPNFQMVLDPTSRLIPFFILHQIWINSYEPPPVGAAGPKMKMFENPRSLYTKTNIKGNSVAWELSFRRLRNPQSLLLPNVSNPCSST